MIDTLKSLLTDFDPAAIFPDLSKLFGVMELILRICVLAGPLCLLGFGLWYLLAPAKEANHHVGYRFYWGMSSVEVWQFTQRLAGLVWTGLGFVMTVVMAIICNGYRDMEVEAMLWSALKCLVWDIGLTVAACLFINVLVVITFDKDGFRRADFRD